MIAVWSKDAFSAEVVLNGKNFGRGHERGLAGVFYGDDRRLQSDDGFAAAHIALEKAVHGHRFFEIGGDFGEDAFLRGGGLERQDFLERFANRVFAHTKGNGIFLAGSFAAEREAELVEEKLFEDQALLSGRVEGIERFEGFHRRGEMSFDQRPAAAGKGEALPQLRGEDVGDIRIEILERGINGAANLARAEGADGFVDGDDAAHFRGIDFVGVGIQDFNLGIHHFAAGGAILVDLDFAVKDQLLAGLEAALEITAVEKLAGQRAGVVLNEQVIDGVAAVHAADGLAAHDAGAQGVGGVRLKVFNFGKMDAVFVAEWKVVQQVFESVDAALGQQFRSLRPNPFQHADVCSEADIHRFLLYIIPAVSSAFRETCAVGMRIDRVAFGGLDRGGPLAEARLTGSEKRALALWIIFGIFGVIFAHKYFFQAFPEASIDFKVTQQEALKRATAFLDGIGENVDGYKSTVVFSQDDDAKTYLERELGLKLANQLMSGEVSTWYWNVRFFKPLQTEEYLVQISPAGQVVAYNHKIEEAKAGKSLRREEALDDAQQFLRSKLAANLENWNFLPEETSSKARPNRLDWSFTWEKKNFKAKDAPYRLEVGIQGDKIGGEQEFLKVPDEWSRSYDRLRSLNNLYETIALIPYGFLLGGALWLGFTMWRRGQTTWAPGFKIGGIVAALYLLMQLNSWSTLNPTYNTQDAYAGFVAQRIFLAVLVSVASGLMVTIVLPGGEPLYRESQPDKLQLYKTFTLRGLRSKEFFSASAVGLALAAAHIGFIVAFYMIGSRLGAWAPQDTNYSDAFNTAIPWIGGVAIGVTAATSEEFLFRLFAIPFLRKLTGSRILAIVLPAFFWGFLHSNYPQEPGYVRGIEVGLIGIVAGLVMLRWGIVATLIWHYTVDASLVGMLLIRSDNLYYKISGVAVGLAAVAPLAWSGISYLVRGRFEPVDDLRNSAAPAPSFDLRTPGHAEEETTTARRYAPLTVGVLGFLALCLVLGPLLAWRLKRERVGEYLQLSVNAAEAKAKADEVMKQHGRNPESLRSAAELIDLMDPVNNEYLRRRMSVEQINQIYATQVPGVLWRVRYFKDSDPEEFAIVLKPDGSMHAFRHTLAEAAKGESLDQNAAVAIGEKFLREEKQIDLSEWKLVSDEAKKQPNRTDHTLTWQQNEPLDPPGPGNQAVNRAEHAYKRVELSVLGDEAANYRTYIKIPEEFTIKIGQRSLLRTLFGFGKGILYVVFALGILAMYFKRSRSDSEFRVPWRKLVVWGIVGLAAYLVHSLCGTGITRIFTSYPTATPWKIYLAGMFVGQGIACALLAGCLVLLYGLLWYFAARAFGKDALATMTGMPGDYYRDAFWLGVGGTAALVGAERVIAAAGQLWPTMERMLPASVGTDFDATYPAVSVIAGAILGSLFITGAIGLAGAFIGAEVRLRAVRLLLLFAVALGFIATWGSPLDFLKHFLQNIALAAFVVAGIIRLVRLNMAGLFLIVTSAALLAGAVPLLGQADGYYKTQGYFVLAATLVLLALPLIQWRLWANRPGGMAEPERP